MYVSRVAPTQSPGIKTMTIGKKLTAHKTEQNLLLKSNLEKSTQNIHLAGEKTKIN